MVKIGLTSFLKKTKPQKSNSHSGNQNTLESQLKFNFRDPFGNIIFLKRSLISILGIASYRRFNIANKTQIQGLENLKNLPNSNILFVSNHETYYADVIGIIHAFCAAKWGLKNINNPLYLLWPKANSYYIAAEETMKDSGWLPKVFSYAGAVTVRRAWRRKGEDVKGNSDIKAPAKIKKALRDGWVINFPQGTTAPNAPIRKGSANIIKALKPIVVPVKIAGFRKAFGKKGLSFKTKGNQLRISIGEPIQFEKQTTVVEIQSYLESKLSDDENTSS